MQEKASLNNTGNALSKLDMIRSQKGLIEKLICPICAKGLRLANHSLICPRNHTFDISRKGSINLLSHPIKTQYDKALFGARKAVINHGFFGPLYRSITEMIDSLSLPKPCTVLDAGCGEGSVLMHLQAHNAKAMLIGMDIAREAIDMAASAAHGGILWCTSDLANMPFSDRSIDIILNILSPANYTHFRRILSPDGYLLKAMPGRAYLQEIRDEINISSAEYDDTQVINYLKEQMTIVKLLRITQSIPVNPILLYNIILMTPLTANLTKEELFALTSQPIEKITFDMHLALCQA